MDSEVYKVASTGSPSKAKPTKGNADADFLAVARARFKQSMDANSVSRASELDDLRFAAGSPDNGWQWPDQIRVGRQNDINGARPCLTINKLTQHIRQVTNDQRQNRPAIKVIPADDNGDVQVAEVYNGLIRHIEYMSNADIAYDTACENQVTIGEGYFRVLTDYCDDLSFEQDLKIARIRSSFSVYMDPMIQDPTGADQQWCFITETMSTDEFRAQYPKAADSDWDVQGIGDNLLQWITEDTVRIAEYFCYESEDVEIVLLADGTTLTKAEYDEVFADFPIPPQIVNRRTSTIKKVIWTKINGAQVLERQEWMGKYIPIIRVVGNEYEVDGRMVVSGIVRNAKDAQRMYNYWVSNEAEMLALAPRAPFVVAAGQIEGFEDKWANANTTNYPYLEYNPISEEGVVVPSPQRVIPPMPSAGILQAKLGAADDIKGTTGQYDASLGQRSNETSGRAIAARQRSADVGTFHFIDNLSHAIRQCGRVLIDMIPKVYDTKRVARIIGEDGETSRVMIDPKAEAPYQKVEQEDAILKIYNPTIGRYDVVVTVGPSFNSRRQEALDGMTALVQANPELWKVIGDLLVKSMDWPGSQEMADRIKKTIDPSLLGGSDESPALQRAMQMIETLQQQGMAMQAIIDNIGKSIEYQKSANDHMANEINIYKAETERMKALAPTMNPEDVQALVTKTVVEALANPPLETEESGFMEAGEPAHMATPPQGVM